MANRLLTSFQTLDSAINGKWDTYNKKYNNTYNISNDDVVYSTTDQVDYAKKKLELQQSAYLQNRWVKANNDLTVQAFNGLNNIKLMYRDADLMDAFPEIGAALDIVSEEACLHGDTRIKLLNGDIKSIKDLYDENYMNFWCYTVDSNGKCKPTKVERVICNGIKDIYEITLDDGTIIKCTDNHKWLLSNKDWVETSNLKVGDSLMSIYDKKDYKGYEKIKSTVENKFKLTHQIVAENILYGDKMTLVSNNEPYQKIVIHHKSFNKLNNDPNQLVYMYWDDHQKLHTDLNSERWNNEEFSTKMRKIFSETNKKTWAEKGDIIRQKLKERWVINKMTHDSEYFRKTHSRPGEQNGMYGVHRYGSENPNYKKNKNHISDINEEEYISYILTLEGKYYKYKLIEHFNLVEKEAQKLNSMLRKKYNVTKLTQLKYKLFDFSKLKKYLIDNINATRCEIMDEFKLSLSEFYRVLEFHGYKNLLDLKESLFNHRVVSIKKTIEQSNVYDLVNSSVNNSFAVKCNNGHVISHNCCNNPLTGHVVNVYSKSERVKAIIEDLLVNRLDIQVTAPMVIRAMCKYGNQFMLLNVQNKSGVLGWRQLPVYNVDRLENGITNPYGVTNQKIDSNDGSTQFILTTDQQTAEPFRNWQIGHFRLLTDSLYLPYGVSYLHKARRHFRMLSLMEDMMMIYRLERSIERRVYKIYVGAIDDADVKSYVEDIANNFKRTPIVDPLTGQLDLRKNLLDVSQDIFIPTRDPSAPTPIDTLSAAQNLTAMDDIKFVQNKVFTALRIPKTFLNFEENVGDGKNLALMDIRFTRTVNRIQQAFLMELTKIVSIHLYLLGFEDELTNFTLSMNNPSTQAEQLEIDNIAKKLSAVRDAVADPGNGIPIMSLNRALKTIMKWSDADIKENFEEMRVERGIAAELEKTSQIIKKTGIFDNIDRIYGEPGAEYQDDNGNQEQDGMGDGGSMGFGGGGAPIGDMPTMDDDNSDMPLGEEDMNGEIGETPMSDNENIMNGGDEQPMENRKKNKPLILETKNNRVDLYDKSFLINEEFDKMIKQLDDYIS